MNRINLLLAVHNHQPVGNFDFVFREAYDRAYKPFLDVLEKHPGVRLSLHYSGVLLDWLEKERPEYITRIRELVSSGQIELLTGAYYEAILPVLPEEDRTGQITMLTKHIKKAFDTTPTGMWLAERVWEQPVARSLAESGVKFVPLDDAHFCYAGLSEEEMLGYYMTEEGGNLLALFPTSKKLRYTIPFQPVERTIEYLRSWASEAGTRILTFGDDGEKFGVWPTTHKHVYENGWLEQFFSALEANSDWLKVRHFTEVMREIPPVGRIYLPTASYPEMLHWVLPVRAFRDYEDFEKLMKEDKSIEKYAQFVHGGFWRNFFVKYPEANVLHKKMLRISNRAHALEKNRKGTRQALRYLWAAQCNDAYWHGVFGGLYLPHLRMEAFRNLLRAEDVLNHLEKKAGYRVVTTDLDCDGREELLIESPLLNLYIKPDEGGSVFEFDYLPVSFNIGNVMTRREEGYHQKLWRSQSDTPTASAESVASIHDLQLAKEQNLGQHLVYDWYRRASLLDHFLGPGVTLDSFSRSRYAELGDFVDQPYVPNVVRKSRSLRVALRRNGHIWCGERHLPLTLLKTLLLKDGSSEVEVEYEIQNPGTGALDLWFGVEFAIGLSAGDAPDRYYLVNGERPTDPRLCSLGSVDSVSSLTLVDEWVGIRVRLDFEQSTTVWRFPIETVSLSEAGFERVYQGSVVFPNWQIRLEKTWRTWIRQTVLSTSKNKRRQS